MLKNPCNTPIANPSLGNFSSLRSSGTLSPTTPNSTNGLLQPFDTQITLSSRRTLSDVSSTFSSSSSCRSSLNKTIKLKLPKGIVKSCLVYGDGCRDIEKFIKNNSVEERTKIYWKKAIKLINKYVKENSILEINIASDTNFSPFDVAFLLVIKSISHL